MKSAKTNRSTKYVSPFAKKMNIVAISALVCGMLIDAVILSSSVGKPPLPIIFGASKFIEIIIWLYLSAILLQFYRRTHLREYILQFHFYWLAGLIAYPLLYISSGISEFLGGTTQPVLFIITQFTFSIIGSIVFLVVLVRSRRRTKLMDAETQNSTALWKSLLTLNLKNIALLQFPVNS